MSPFPGSLWFHRLFSASTIRRPNDTDVAFPSLFVPPYHTGDRSRRVAASM
ncbi:hypothetical protein [Pasteuria penetrans]|uniref:hypothetical protein n=1 Tax=Pasteuria penetrans TaxID=86005 RepID=UPI001CAA4BB4|nr:hypothetical protein [Pasteuria penetrans]